MSKTINELFKISGGKGTNSVKYGDSRCVLNHFETPLLGYAVWKFGVIVIFKDYASNLKSFSYSIYHPFSTFPIPGFAQMDVDQAIKFIKEEKNGIIESYLDETKINELKQKIQFERPFIGEIIYKESQYNSKKDTTTYINKPDEIKYSHYKVYRYKNGNFRIERKNSWGDGTTGENTKDFAECFTKIYRQNGIWKMTIPKEVVQELLDFNLLNKI